MAIELDVKTRMGMYLMYINSIVIEQVRTIRIMHLL